MYRVEPYRAWHAPITYSLLFFYLLEYIFYIFIVKGEMLKRMEVERLPGVTTKFQNYNIDNVTFEEKKKKKT